MRRRRACVAAVVALGLVGCEKPPASAAPPAKVDNGVTESSLTTITLTPAAVRNLGIETAVVDSTSAAPTREVGGEVIVPPGHALMVSAPVAGTVLAPANGGLPAAGARVARGQPLMRLVALPPDRDLLRSQQDLSVAEARYLQAEAEAKRVAELFTDRVVSAKENEVAQADLAAARAVRDAARAQAGLVHGAGISDAASLSPLTIRAPDAGVIRTISVGPGQSVAAGSALVEVIRVDRLWVRVPVYAGDARSIARSVPVTIHGLAGATGGPVVRGYPVVAPPSADPAAASVDVFYEIRDAAPLRPGERVAVTVPLAQRGARSLGVPLSAIIHDMNGGTWVYERRDSVTFVRRRVEVERTVDGIALLSRGPAPGVRIVTAGAAELFGTEFGSAK